MAMSAFSLAGKALKLEDDSEIAALTKDIEFTTLDTLVVSGNSFGIDASIGLAGVLQKCSNIRIVDLSDILTGRLISEIPVALTALCYALVDKRSLEELDLSDNAFGGRSVEPMVPFLARNTSVKSIKLNNNGLGPAGGIVIAGAIRDSAGARQADDAHSRPLETIVCGRNRLENGSAVAWAEAIDAHASTIIDVRLPQNGIREAGLCHILRALSYCVKLQYLDLQDNLSSENDSDTAWRALAEGVSAWKDIRVINLSDCALANKGAVILLEAITEKHSALEELCLQNNDLDSKVLPALEGAIRRARNLRRVEVQWNEIKTRHRCAIAVAQVLESRGGKLVCVDEDEDEADEEGEEEEESEEEDVEERSDVPTTGAAAVPRSGEVTRGLDTLVDELAQLSVHGSQ